MALPSPVSRSTSLGDDGTARGTLNLSGVQTAGAHPDFRDLSIHHHARDLKVRLPDPARPVVGVRHVVPMSDTLVAHEAAISCDFHLVHQLDASHLGAVAFAMSYLQDPRVSPAPRSKLRTDFSEQFIVDRTLVHMTTSQATIVQRARACLRDQLLDERTELLGSCFSRLDRSTLDESSRETAHQRELLLTGAF